MQDEAFIEEVLAKCEALRDSRLWVPQPKLNPRAWIHNFQTTDRAVAAAILNQVLFVSASTFGGVLQAAFAAFQQGHSASEESPQSAEQSFSALVQRSKFCPVEGEEPNPTDSGNAVSRAFRDRFDIPETQICRPVQTISHATTGGSICLFDDCIGSGNQVIEMWERDYDGNSLSSSYQTTQFDCSLIAAIATEEGRKRIEESTPIRVFAGHVLSDRHSIFTIPDLPQLPTRLPLSYYAIDLLNRTAPRLRFPDKPFMLDGNHAALGFSELGHTLIFEHGCPDWSLPVLWADGTNNWHPLYEKSE